MNSLHLSLTLTQTIFKFSPVEPSWCIPTIAVLLFYTPPPPLTFLFFYLSPALYFFSLRPTSFPLLLCVLSQALRVLCIPQIQCHPFILHQETLTPIFWGVHKAAQPHDPEDEGRIESDGQRHGRGLEPETDEGFLSSSLEWKYM